MNGDTEQGSRSNCEFAADMVYLKPSREAYRFDLPTLILPLTQFRTRARRPAQDTKTSCRPSLSLTVTAT